MLTLKAKIRKETGKKTKALKEKGALPAVLYGPKIKNSSLEIDLKEFNKILGEAGESSLISLEVGKDKFPVLIHDIKKESLDGRPIHVDFYQPILTKEVEVAVPVVFVGEAPAVKDLGGTLVKEMQEIKVKALPQNLPHAIKVSVEKLKTFEDEIMIKDLILPEGVKILKDQNEIIAKVLPPVKVEEELEKPIEEKVEEVEKVEKEKKEEVEESTEEKSAPKPATAPTAPQKK